MKNKIAYKFIQSDMSSKNGNHKWEIGKWYKETDIKICEKGFHACKKPLDSLEYVYGDKWFIVEYKGKVIEQDDKFCSKSMRLIKEIPIEVVKRFAIWCAKQCLKNYEKEYPYDKRPSEAIKAAEDYLDKKIGLAELNKKLSAAESAARSARSAAESAAWSAKSAAAWSARSAAESAAWSARSAAESAARSAKSAAAWSARSAAESAARSAESAAAWSAAWSAQNKQLLKLIKEYTK